MNELHSGVVMQSTGACYIVEAENGTLYRCRTIPGTRTENEDTSLVAVGDRVTFKAKTTSSDELEGVITNVAARTSFLERRRDIRRNRSKEKSQVIASNIDQLVIVTSAVNPPLNKRLIDRYLVFAESEDLSVLIVVNKTDLARLEEITALMSTYEHLGYRICYVSASNGLGMESFRSELAGKLSAFSGHSGVGKSTLINKLIGSKVLRTARTSMKTHKGVHTTSNSVMLSLPGGGYVIDTPGIREFNLSDITKENLRFYFRDFLPLMPDCAYSSCSHTVEPDCAVIHAVESGTLDPERYESYLALYLTLDGES